MNKELITVPVDTIQKKLGVLNIDQTNVAITLISGTPPLSYSSCGANHWIHYSQECWLPG